MPGEALGSKLEQVFASWQGKPTGRRHAARLRSRTPRQPACAGLLCSVTCQLAILVAILLACLPNRAHADRFRHRRAGSTVPQSWQVRKLMLDVLGSLRYCGHIARERPVPAKEVRKHARQHSTQVSHTARETSRASCRAASWHEPQAEDAQAMNASAKQREHKSYPQPTETRAQVYARRHESDASREPVRRPLDSAPRRGEWN